MTTETHFDPLAMHPANRPGGPLEPCAFVLFGASGDLAHRMVVPALFRLWRKGCLPQPFQILG
jgi:glucose-6-phosphate 1-dehydrogenase